MFCFPLVSVREYCIEFVASFYIVVAAMSAPQLYHAGGDSNGERMMDQMRKTKRHDDNPERAVLDAGKKRPPLVKVENEASRAPVCWLVFSYCTGKSDCCFLVRFCA